MDDNKLKDRILSNTYTVGDLRKRMGILKVFLERYFFNEKNLKDGNLYSKISELLYDENNEDIEKIKEWGEDFFEEFTLSNMYNKLESILNSFKDVGKIVLYIPKKIDIKSREEIGKWLREEISNIFLIEFLIDKNALGGCKFVWRNKSYDFSLDYFFNKEEGNIHTLVNSYARSN